MLERDQFREVKRLKCFLETKSKHHQWLFVPEDTQLTLDTFCVAIRSDFEGFDECIEDLTSSQMCEFLSTFQLEDIVENLRQQKSTYTDADLLSAVEFYFERDAFIDLSGQHLN